MSTPDEEYPLGLSTSELDVLSIVSEYFISKKKIKKVFDEIEETAPNNFLPLLLKLKRNILN